METSNCGRKPFRFGLVLFFLGVIGILLYRGSDRLVDSSTQIACSYQVMARLDVIQLLLQENESMQLAFLATGDTAFFDRADAVAEKVKLEFVSESDKTLRKNLVGLTRKEWEFSVEFSTIPEELSEKKMKLVEELEELIRERQQYTKTIIGPGMGDASRRKAAQDLADGKGKEISARIEAKIAEIRRMEEPPLKERLVEVRNSAEYLGDVVVAMHFVYVGVVVVGLLAVLVGGALHWQWVRNVRFRCIHLTMILIVVVESVLNIECPLTRWERDLKLSADLEKFEGGFIARWMHQIVQRDGAKWEDHQWIFEAAYIGVGALVLVSFWLVPPCRRKKVMPPPPTQAPPPPTRSASEEKKELQAQG